MQLLIQEQNNRVRQVSEPLCLSGKSMGLECLTSWFSIYNTLQETRKYNYFGLLKQHLSHKITFIFCAPEKIIFKQLQDSILRPKSKFESFMSLVQPWTLVKRRSPIAPKIFQIYQPDTPNKESNLARHPSEIRH